MHSDNGIKPESVVYLPSTVKGLVGKYSRNTVFLVAGGIGAVMLNSASHTVAPVPIKSSYELRQNLNGQFDRGEISRNELERGLSRLDERTDGTNNGMSESDREVMSWLLWLGAIASSGAALANGYGLIDNRYRARRVNNVDTEKGRITTTSYTFPYGTSTHHEQIDKITSVTARQGSIERMLGTGEVIIHGVVYTSAGSKDVNHTIPYIENPHKAKDEILERLPERVGLELRVRDGEKMPGTQKVGA